VKRSHRVCHSACRSTGGMTNNRIDDPTIQYVCGRDYPISQVTGCVSSRQQADMVAGS
jgi:hypothetical protein